MRTFEELQALAAPIPALLFRQESSKSYVLKTTLSRHETRTAKGMERVIQRLRRMGGLADEPEQERPAITATIEHKGPGIHGRTVRVDGAGAVAIMPGQRAYICNPDGEPVYIVELDLSDKRGTQDRSGWLRVKASSEIVATNNEGRLLSETIVTKAAASNSILIGREVFEERGAQ